MNIIELLFTATIQGIGTAIGIWIGTQYGVRRLEKQDEEFFKQLKEKSELYKILQQVKK